MYGVVPPVACNFTPVGYFTLTCPSGRLVVMTVSGGGGMIVNAADATALLTIFVLKATAWSVHELVKVMAVFAYAVDLLVGVEPLVV